MHKIQKTHKWNLTKKLAQQIILFYRSSLIFPLVRSHTQKLTPNSTHSPQFSVARDLQLQSLGLSAMKFGKEFKTHLEQTLPEWRDKFLCYKPLKKLIKHYPNLPSTPAPIPTNHSLNFLLPPLQGRVLFDDSVAAASLESVRGHCETGAGSLADLQDWFVRILNEELEKLNDFYVDKEEEFVIRFQVVFSPS